MATISSTSNLRAIALYDNVAESPDELEFTKGDTVEVIERNLPKLDGWWLCQRRGRTGIAPANRLQLVTNRVINRKISSSAESKLGITRSTTKNSTMAEKTGADRKHSVLDGDHQQHTRLNASFHSANDYDYISDNYNKSANKDNQKMKSIDLPDYDVPVSNANSYYRKDSKNGSSNTVNSNCAQSRDFADYDEIEERIDYDIPESVKDIKQPDYDVPTLADHREDHKSVEVSEQPSYDIPVSYSEDARKGIATGLYHNKNDVGHSEFQYGYSDMDNNQDYDIPEARCGSQLHEIDIKTMDKSINQPDYDIPDSHESVLVTDSKDCKSDEVGNAQIFHQKDYDISSRDSLNQCSQAPKEENKVFQSKSALAVAAGPSSKFRNEQQSELPVDTMMTFKAENYKYSAIYARSEDFSTKISKWKQRSSSFKGIDLNILVGLTYIDHLQREIFDCSKNLTGHKKLGWHTVSSLKSTMRSIRIHLKKLYMYIVDFVDVGKRSLVNCYYSSDEGKEVARVLKEGLHQLVEIRNTISESYKELDSINWKIEYISSQYSGTLDRVMLVTSQMPKLCNDFFLLVLKNADIIFDKNISVGSENFVGIEDPKLDCDTYTDTILQKVISDTVSERTSAVKESESLGKPSYKVDPNLGQSSAKESITTFVEKNSPKHTESNIEENTSDKTTEDPELITMIFDQHASEFQQKFQSLGEEFKILVKCIREQEGVNVILEESKKIIVGAHSLIFVADFCNDRIPDCDVKQELQNRITKLVDAITTFASAAKKASENYPSKDSLQGIVRASKDLSAISKELVIYATSLKTK
ncbi:Breast cancer anti-estrogen resistance protein 1 [Trichoplax sp. H2]|nr:Breast cancer anti-estrogen resistance protein 1 [Trichoplax sp. H2]|eukprot:RDD47115.1 Breast cancer anti-estrogen resistance protein 1 [Trichoplax sp. H2]